MFAILMDICSSCETVADDAADDAYEPGGCADVAYDDDGGPDARCASCSPRTGTHPTTTRLR